ncbi:MAG: MerR family transcriptional regulator [Clostridia bacterium]|nr:MerR family transcriptional regulator [Clostridia bacterium]
MVRYLRGQIAQMANIHSETLIYYERNQLIPPPDRTETGYRLYSGEVLDRLEFIRQAKEVGFTLEEIRQQLEAIDHKEADLQFVYESLKRKYDEICVMLEQLENKKRILLEVKDKIFDPNQCPSLYKLIK